MSKGAYTLSIFLIFTLFSFPHVKATPVSDALPVAHLATYDLQQDQGSGEQDQSAVEVAEEEVEEHTSAPAWTVIPFVLLLLMIATGPLFYEHFWHKNYPLIAVLLAVTVVSYYVFILSNQHDPIHAFAEYLQFIALLSSLYIASGGILIKVDKKATPMANSLLLIIGSVIANLIGTTGASMLLIRPFIRLNKNRIKPYHIVFFIFMVSNIGGALTPIGDPPLFLGFLRGVPFFWTLEHNFVEWAVALVIIVVIFYIIDRRNKPENGQEEDLTTYTNKISLVGTRNFLWLGVVILAVFIDPNKFDFVPGIEYHGATFSFVRELIMFSVAYLSFRFASREALKGNDFSFEPIREVAFIFIGIFGTMMPALEIVGSFARSEAGAALITHNTLYWGTGVLSGFLDNAPTYLNFLAAAMASQGASIGDAREVVAFAQGEYHDSILRLTAISVASVFFGAMTYIGNGPNFMVKSIAEQIGIKMPSFFGYIIRFSLPFLLPALILIWLLFFAFQPV
ncbi:sodium:proton antiporter [Catalinimonas niigatensis]|uniref:sodium:proton antiporter n=1 Tax=Catalinimonas niigatensis TaxID=1397264 RepID=UPI002664F07F|nr:sodium:proton antiporter [Catalinimonas niigatensis]WPP48842.1 sodium:proton antiporter [Catalinimonas niigatensis]